MSVQKLSVLAVAAILLSSTPLCAALNTGPAITGFSGSVDVVGTLVNATVTYGAYAPGDFPYSIPASFATDHIYAYELVNNGSFTITEFSVRLDQDESIGDFGFIGTGGSLGQNNGNAAFWGSLGITSGVTSPIFYFGAPHSPEMDNVRVKTFSSTTVVDGVASPSNLPEPGTLLLAVMASLGILTARTRNRDR
ncbi:MAG: hypothetical protein MI725_02410 [Pirellulales bacterium]|nr:hypothetical protein [Pirellulales bacterium]